MTDVSAFTTARMRAERLQDAHAPEIHRMHSDAAQMAMLGGVRDEASTAEYMERNLRHWTTYGYGLWILRDRTSGDVIGRTLLRHLEIDGRDEVETGYSFHPPYWGRGLATEAARECVRIGRDVIGLVSIVAITMPENAASRRVLEKAGLVYEREIAGPRALYRTRD